MDKQERARQRAAAQALITRAREDREFARRLQDDPEAVLSEAGLPREGADDLRREAPGGTDDPDSVVCAYTCDWTCIFTSL